MSREELYMPNPRATITFTAKIAGKYDWPTIPGGYMDGNKFKVFTVEMEFDGVLRLKGERGARYVLTSAGFDFSGWTVLSRAFETLDPNRIDQVYEFYRWLEKQPGVTLVEHIPLQYEVPQLPPDLAS